jgi:hypothetical protein
MAVYYKNIVKYPNACVHKIRTFWFWGKLVYAVTALVYELQEEYIVYPTLTSVMQKGGIYCFEEK